MSSPLPYLTPNRLWESREDQSRVSAPFNDPQETARLPVLLILLGPIIFNDNSSSRIGFKFYKYVSKLIFATFWVLKKRKNFKVSFFFPVLSITVHSGLHLPTTVLTPLSLQDALFLASQARSPRCRISHACVSARLLHIQ